MKHRINKLSQKFKLVKVADDYILMAVMDDLSDEELRDQFAYYLNREDFEYLEQIVAEATLRGIKFKMLKNGEVKIVSL